jgi:hypothetical protein
VDAVVEGDAQLDLLAEQGRLPGLDADARPRDVDHGAERLIVAIQSTSGLHGGEADHANPGGAAPIVGVVHGRPDRLRTRTT